MTLLKTQTLVACPKTGQDADINTVEGCRWCQFLGPVHYVGKTRVLVVCHYGEPAADKAGSAQPRAATVQDPAAQAAGPATN